MPEVRSRRVLHLRIRPGTRQIELLRLFRSWLLDKRAFTIRCWPAIIAAMLDPSAPRVFLSYSRKDGLEFARRLQAILEAEGLSLYRDLSDLEGGEDWWRQVETAI